MVRTTSDKVQIGRIERSLVEQTKQYKELTGTSRVELVESLLADFFKDKVLDNDFIDLPKPYYFNMMELKEEGIVKATTIKPIKDLEKTFVLFNVPNNLDSFNAEANSYCYEDNIQLHRGYYVASEFSEFNVKLELVFSYNTSSEELEIAISNDRDLYFSLEQKEEKEKLVTEEEIYLPDLDSTIILDYAGLNLVKYSEYKYLVVEQEERYKEDLEFIEKLEKQEEEVYKNQ